MKPVLLLLRKIPPEEEAKPSIIFHCRGCGQWLPKADENGWAICQVPACQKPNKVGNWGLQRLTA